MCPDWMESHGYRETEERDHVHSETVQEFPIQITYHVQEQSWKIPKHVVLSMLTNHRVLI